MVLLGTDLIEINRIRRSMYRPGFLKRILGPQEYVELQARIFPVQSVAASFCAKEAFLKSIGKGIGCMDFRDIELLREPTGKPYLKISNIPKEYRTIGFSVSITHTKEYALAVVVAECEDKNENYRH